MTREKKTNDLMVILAMDFALVVFYLRFSIPALLYIMLGLTLLSVIIPPLRHWIATGFNAVTRFIGKGIRFVVLTLFFFTFLTPLSWLRKAVGRSAPTFSRKAGRPSYFESVQYSAPPEDFEKSW
jgi:hypothetical protein